MDTCKQIKDIFKYMPEGKDKTYVQLRLTGINIHTKR